MTLQQAANHPEENCQIATGVESMVEASQAAPIFVRIKLRKRLRWMIPEVRKRSRRRCEDRLDVAVGEGRHDESHNFLIEGVVVAMDKLDGVVRNVTFPRKGL